ncbi:Maf1 regulator-domain-containing protein [Lobosporangium transversale]|uniref:Repressor of RNA polymerase III transcription MAF1 n=1 Tax=Lobosporangium transversale TaxID=64571 RepID=A0A1Y2GEN6_9FUNG|nr:Maf1 regulator-domain-containing protein [Lobosporangium transversale]ORZ06966.1 Maf1 regulator-domain-containing protein [Lobosporangium transversale]|eukprot:XP_021877762.1 Maf1 regulator-domain-containing protein [Lobosporangium transversale]
MKYLEYPGMDNINSALNFETPECRVHGRVEPYSCKAAGADKKLYKQLENKYDPTSPNNTLSPPDDDGFNNIRNIISPFGPMNQPASRKTLFYLIGTLNASFPDYDFSDVKPEQFRKEPSVSIVVNSINSTLLNHGNERAVKDIGLWEAIDQLIELADSDVYSYNPESDSDPNDEEGGTLWSFNYFFYNRKLKRIIYFTMRGVSHNVLTDDDDMEDNYNSDDDNNIGFAQRKKR